METARYEQSDPETERRWEQLWAALDTALIGIVEGSPALANNIVFQFFHAPLTPEEKAALYRTCNPSLF